MNIPLTLYYAPDNASLCVRLALLNAGLPFECVLVDRASGGQRGADYLALNPNGLIPTLITPDGPIYETAAILMWTAQKTQTLSVTDTTWLFWLSNTLHPAMRMNFYPDKYIAAEAVPALLDATRRNLDGLFAHLDVHAAWLDRRDVGLLGCYLAPIIRWSALYGQGDRWFEIAKYPRLHAFAAWFEDHPCAHQASLAEGLGDTIFTKPQRPNPPEGSAV